MSPMVITKQKHSIDTQPGRKAHKHTMKENHEFTREEIKRKEKRRTTKKPQKTSFKTAVSTYISVITLNSIYVILQSKDIRWLNE